MIRPVLLAALVAAPALAQTPSSVTSDPAMISTPALVPTADQFRQDLRTVTNMVATAALVHDATGAFPTTAFGLLGSPAARRTALRATPLSTLNVFTDEGRLVLDYVPLPTDPYVREDKVVRVVVTPGADGRYTGDYEIRRRDDLDRGGRMLPYDQAGRFLVRRGYGTACVDLATVQDRLAAGTYAPEPGTLSTEPLTIRVHPTDEETPVYYQTTESR